MKGTNEYHLTTFDPGAAASGWTHFIVDYRAFSRPDNLVVDWIKEYDHGEYTGPEHKQYQQAVNHIHHVVDAQGLGVSYMSYDVVSEEFQLTQLIGGADNLLSPVRFNAVLDWECQKRAVHFTLQARQLRTNVTKDRLRKMGFPQRFRKDEFAAMQHAITWLRRMKLESLKRPWKLSDPSIMNARWDCACERRKPCDMLHPQTK